MYFVLPPPNEMLTFAYFLDIEHCNNFFPITFCSLPFPRHLLTPEIVTVCYICLWLKPYRKCYKDKKGKWEYSKHETVDFLSANAFLRALTMFYMHHRTTYTQKEKYVCWVACYHIPGWHDLPTPWVKAKLRSQWKISATKLPRALSVHSKLTCTDFLQIHPPTMPI